MFLLTSNTEYPVIDISDPIDPRREILAMPGCMQEIRIPTYKQPCLSGDNQIKPTTELLMCKTIFLLTSNLGYTVIQVSDPIDPRREISGIPGCI